MAGSCLAAVCDALTHQLRPSDAGFAEGASWLQTVATWASANPGSALKMRLKMTAGFYAGSRLQEDAA
jgi:hypothetical protein